LVGEPLQHPSGELLDPPIPPEGLPGHFLLLRQHSQGTPCPPPTVGASLRLQAMEAAVTRKHQEHVLPHHGSALEHSYSYVVSLHGSAAIVACLLQPPGDSDHSSQGLHVAFYGGRVVHSS
jgi:hypothetical protein